MNPLNYASIEASKALVDMGIVIETEAFWHHDGDGVYSLRHYGSIPAPSMAEVWRELPRYIEVKGYYYELIINKEPDMFTCGHLQDFFGTVSDFAGYLTSTDPDGVYRLARMVLEWKEVE